MRTVIQRVTRASVTVAGEVVGAIDHGALLLVGIEPTDTEDDIDATAEKITKLRFFPGRTPMDKNLGEVGGGCLVVSQFTLAAALRKGNRPSFTGAADPSIAEPLYLRLAERLAASGLRVATGTFGADMAVELVNDGPVTFLLFARNGRIVELETPA